MKKISIIFASLFSAIVAHGATVNLTDIGQQTGFADSSGGALAIGNWVRMGYFTSNSYVTSNISDTTALNSGFVQFDAWQIGSGFSFNGVIQAAYNQNSYSDTGKQIYIWATQASTANNNTSSLAALTNATAQAIFYAPNGTFSSWTFPADGFPAASIDIGDAKSSGTYLAGSYVSSDAALTTIYNGVGISGTIGAVQLATVTAVPEPSTLTFGALAAFVAAGVRRRRRT